MGAVDIPVANVVLIVVTYRTYRTDQLFLEGLNTSATVMQLFLVGPPAVLYMSQCESPFSRLNSWYVFTIFLLAFATQ